MAARQSRQTSRWKTRTKKNRERILLLSESKAATLVSITYIYITHLYTNTSDESKTNQRSTSPRTSSSSSSSLFSTVEKKQSVTVFHSCGWDACKWATRLLLFSYTYVGRCGKRSVTAIDISLPGVFRLYARRKHLFFVFAILISPGWPIATRWNWYDFFLLSTISPRFSPDGCCVRVMFVIELHRNWIRNRTAKTFLPRSLTRTVIRFQPIGYFTERNFARLLFPSVKEREREKRGCCFLLLWNRNISSSSENVYPTVKVSA